MDKKGKITCRIASRAQFWNNTYWIFQDDVENDDDAITALSKSAFPDGTPVDRVSIYGTPETDMNDTTLTSLKSYIVTIVLPNVDDAAKFETEAIDAILALDEKWEAENNSNFKVEVFADRSFSDEFTR